MDEQELTQIIERNKIEQNGLIAMLYEVQSKIGYLPEIALKLISKNTGRSLIDIYSVASFYNAFSLTPRGKHIIKVCMGTACHVRGAVPILGELQRKLEIKTSETTDDKQFTLETVNCLGACALGPIVVVDDNYHVNTRAQKVTAILAKYSESCDNEDKAME
ncbi:MAG: NAD(P)H-dependent oxidoreductase subunit E [bacterium]|nr:NAD(P)H-dependent oxidoreductase subunit E [bacterium]